MHLRTKVCLVCMDFAALELLSCEHSFCSDCINQVLKMINSYFFLIFSHRCWPLVGIWPRNTYVKKLNVHFVVSKFLLWIITTDFQVFSLRKFNEILLEFFLLLSIDFTINLILPFRVRFPTCSECGWRGSAWYHGK
jgi:hypothetical protein